MQSAGVGKYTDSELQYVTLSTSCNLYGSLFLQTFTITLDNGRESPLKRVLTLMYCPFLGSLVPMSGGELFILTK